MPKKLSPMERQQRYQENKKKLEKQAKIEKAKAKLNEKLKQRLENLKGQYNKLRQDKIAKINKRYERKLEIQTNKVLKQYSKMRGNKEKKIRGKEIVKKEDWKLWWKKATNEIQLYKRISQADSKGNVYTMDGKRRNYKACCGGHYRGKHNCPQLVFEPDNIRPITGRTNEVQLDQPGYMRKDEFIKKIGLDRYNELEKISKDKGLKEECYKLNRNIDYLKSQYYKRENHNRIIFETLGIKRD